MESPTLESAACLGCSCLCDDIRLATSGREVRQAEPACEIGERWFCESESSLSACSIDGQPAAVEAGMARAVELLVAAQAPVTYGLSRTTTPAQREAIALSERLGGTIDVEMSREFRAATLAKSRVGYVSATLGELRSRCDTAVLWCDDFTATHPRFFERYLDAERYITIGPSTGWEQLNQPLAIHLALQQQSAALLTLLLLLDGRSSEPAFIEQQTGHPIEVWRDLLQRLKEAKYGLFIYDGRLATEKNYELLFQLTRRLNDYTRFVCSSPVGPANVVGAMQAMTWTTGYPCGVNFAQGYPTYDPHQYHAPAMWERRETDLTLIIGSDPLAHGHEAAIHHLKTTPSIAIDWQATDTMRAATVAFQVAQPGIDAGGIAYRLDGVPLAMQTPVDSSFLSDADVLGRLRQAVS
jgi:formylmethanofuran dehydrogenase subunit B